MKFLPFLDIDSTVYRNCNVGHKVLLMDMIMVLVQISSFDDNNTIQFNLIVALTN